MVFPNRKIVERLQQEFPFGCRVVLDQMDDLQAPPIGTQGVCRGVDDTGSVMVSWDTGSSLNVVYGADRCHRVASEAEIKESLDWMGKERHKPTHCPRCGAVEEQNNRLLALSRRADITICEACGVFESLEDFGLLERKELADWAIAKKCWTE